MVQYTLSEPFSLQGVGVHSGNMSSITLHPAPPNTGYIFKRVDLHPAQTIQAILQNVTSTQRCTKISNSQGTSVMMVEHVLSALRGMNIDNAIIDVHGEELPILDGSAFYIASNISKIGILRQTDETTYLHLHQHVRIDEGSSFLEAYPDSSTSYDISFQNDHNISYLGDHAFEFQPEHQDYLLTIAPARTFCYEKEITVLKHQGLIQGAAAGQGIIIGINQTSPPLQFHDELARHKLLDLMGDLALIPPFHARIKGSGISHGLNNRFAKMLQKHLT